MKDIGHRNGLQVSALLANLAEGYLSILIVLGKQVGIGVIVQRIKACVEVLRVAGMNELFVSSFIRRGSDACCISFVNALVVGFDPLSISSLGTGFLRLLALEFRH